MEKIAAGKGAGPKPFMMQGVDAELMPCGTAITAMPPTSARANRQSRLLRPKRAARVPSIKMPDFIAPQLCATLSRPPAGANWVHEIKFDGYRSPVACRRWRRHAEDPQRPGLDGEVWRHRKRGKPSARWHHRWRDRRARRKWRTRFRRSASRAVGAPNEGPDLLCFRSAVRGRRRSARTASDGTQGTAERRCLARSIAARKPSSAMSSTSQMAAMRCCSPPVGFRLKASSRKKLMQPMCRAEPIPGRNRNAVPGMRSSSVAGRPPTASSGRCWLASTAATISPISAVSEPATARQRSSSCCRG